VLPDRSAIAQRGLHAGVAGARVSRSYFLFC